MSTESNKIEPFSFEWYTAIIRYYNHMIRVEGVRKYEDSRDWLYKRMKDKYSYDPVSPSCPGVTRDRLIRCAIAGMTTKNVRGDEPDKTHLWVAVRDTFSVGSTVAGEICKYYGFDPMKELYSRGMEGNI